MKEFFATNRLSAYIDGQLTDAEMAEVEKSIRENPAVRSEYNRMLHAVELVRTQGPVAAPVGFKERLEARLAVERAPKARFRWLPAPLRRLPMEAIGLALAAILVVSVIQRDPALESEDSQEPETVAQEEAPSSESLSKSEALEGGEVEQERAVSEPSTESERRPVEQAAERKEAVQRRSVSPKSQKGGSTETVGMGLLPQLQEADASQEAASDNTAIDWEDQYQEAGNTAAGLEAEMPTVNIGPVRYRLYPKSSEVLWQIQRLAERYGAYLQKPNGTSLSPFSMTTESNYANLKLQMSPQRMESFVAALRELGAMSLVQQEETRLYSGGMMELELEVQFEP